jgi:hypothetical protein
MVAALRGPGSAHRIGASPSGKAADFDSAIRRFESSRPSQDSPPRLNRSGLRHRCDGPARGSGSPGFPALATVDVPAARPPSERGPMARGRKAGEIFAFGNPWQSFFSRLPAISRACEQKEAGPQLPSRPCFQGRSKGAGGRRHETKPTGPAQPLAAIGPPPLPRRGGPRAAETFANLWKLLEAPGKLPGSLFTSRPPWYLSSISTACERPEALLTRAPASRGARRPQAPVSDEQRPIASRTAQSRPPRGSPRSGLPDIDRGRALGVAHLAASGAAVDLLALARTRLRSELGLCTGDGLESREFL